MVHRLDTTLARYAPASIIVGVDPEEGTGEYSLSSVYEVVERENVS
jgi:hypothetical protein